MSIIFHSPAVDSTSTLSSCFDLLKLNDGFSLCHIAGSFDEERDGVDDTKRLLPAESVSKFFYLSLPQVNEQQQVQRALECSVILIPEGELVLMMDTFRVNGFASDLQEFLTRGGVIIAVGIAGMCLTPSMSLIPFMYPDFSISRQLGLRLVEFEFFPYFEQTVEELSRLTDYSIGKEQPLYAASKGSSIIIDKEKRMFIGEIFAFIDGMHYQV